MRASDITAAFTEADELEGGGGKGAWDRVWDGQVWCLGWWRWFFACCRDDYWYRDTDTERHS